MPTNGLIICMCNNFRYRISDAVSGRVMCMTDLDLGQTMKLSGIRNVECSIPEIYIIERYRVNIFIIFM